MRGRSLWRNGTPVALSDAPMTTVEKLSAFRRRHARPGTRTLCIEAAARANPAGHNNRRE